MVLSGPGNGTWRSTNGRAEIDCSAASTSETRADVWSILLTKIMCGTWRSSRNLSSGDSARTRSGTASHTTTATSAASIAICASVASSTDPGQSRKNQRSPRYVACAGLISVDICRARASGAESPTVVWSFWVPRRWMVSAAKRRDSRRVVLPDRYGPTRAATRGPPALSPMVASASRRAPRPARVRPVSGLDQERPAWRRCTLRQRWSRRRRMEATGIWRRGLLQRGAGALDTLARLGQRLIRGRVGDAEIGRQAEGLALDHRDAF